MAAYNKFNSFVEAIAEKVHNFGSDTIKLMLTNGAPSASNTVKANLTEIAAGNGYPAGGPAVTITSSAQSSGLYKLVGNDLTITASGGNIGPFRYAVLYNDTPTSPADPLIGWYDYGSSTTIFDGESLVVDFDGTGGILTLA